MGGQSSSQQQQTQQSTTNPWAQAQPALQGILGQLNGLTGQSGINPAQTGALNTIENNGNFYGGVFTPRVSDITNGLLNGGGANDQAGNISGNLDQYKSWLTPYANGSMMGQNNGLQPYLNTIQNDVTNQVNGNFAAAGRDFSPANSQALARGVAQGEAPVIANQYNQDVSNRLGAASSLYGAGNTTGGLLSGLQNQFNQNRAAGVGMIPNVVGTANSGPQATLEAEAQRLGIPTQALGLLAQIGVPIAGLGSSSMGNSTGNTTNQMSGADQFAKIAGGIGAMMPKAPMSFSF